MLKYNKLNPSYLKNTMIFMHGFEQEWVKPGALGKKLDGRIGF